jgi:AcrR family transcriptional regulator
VNKHKLKSDKAKALMKEAAFQLFAEKGYAATSIDDITKQAGYTKGAFYTHFNNKEEIFLQIMDERMLMLHQQIQEGITGKIDSTDTKELVNNIFNFLLESTQNETWTSMYIEFIANSNRISEIQNKLSIMYRDWKELIKNMLDILVSKKQITPKISNEDLAVAIIALFDGFNIQHHVDRTVELKKQIKIIHHLLGID